MKGTSFDYENNILICLWFVVTFSLEQPPAPSPPTPSGGPQTAVNRSNIFQSVVSVCENYGSSCSSASAPRPETIDGCQDGSSAYAGYSVRDIKVLGGNSAGANMREGDTVTITANVVTDTKASDTDTDYLDFYYSSDTSVDPIWQHISTQLPKIMAGSQQLSVTYTLPNGGSNYQAVRVQLRYGGTSNNACDMSGTEGGRWNDRDDLVFKVQKSNSPGQPTPGQPTNPPTKSPTKKPTTTAQPTNTPTKSPTKKPTTEKPTAVSNSILLKKY
jgi:cell division septation protein DedD